MNKNEVSASIKRRMKSELKTDRRQALKLYEKHKDLLFVKFKASHLQRIVDLRTEFPEEEDKTEVINEADQYFYSLVRKPTKKRKRHCLKCKTVFLSQGSHNRTCGSCSAQNARKPLLAQVTFIENLK